MSEALSDLVDWLSYPPQGFVHFGREKCRESVDAIIQMQAELERLRKKATILHEFEQWLKREVDYLQTAQRTEFGDGVLAADLKATRELQDIERRTPVREQVRKAGPSYRETMLKAYLKS